MERDAEKERKCHLCGRDLPQQEFRFCPFCGGKLETQKQTADSIELKVGGRDKDSVKQPAPVSGSEQALDFSGYDWASSVEDIARCYEDFISDKRKDGVPQQVISEQARQLVNHLKNKLQATIKIATRRKLNFDNKTVKRTVRQDVAYYSVILKYCPNRETLAKALEKVLLRSYPAIRLAVERTPCIIVYKAKLENMHDIIGVFMEQNAAISVIFGDFDADMGIETFFEDFKGLADEIKSMLIATPITLWLGDSVYDLVTDSYLDDTKGITAVTDQGLYFCDEEQPSDEVQWTVVPFYRVRQVNEVSDGLDIYCIDTESPLALTFDFSADKDRVAAAVARAMSERHYGMLEENSLR